MMKRTLKNVTETVSRKPCTNRESNIRRSPFSFKVIVVT